MCSHHKQEVESLKRCREIILKYKDYEFLNQDDMAFMLSVLKYHPDRAKKIKGGVKSMWIQKSSFKTRGFWLEREDGSKTDFSFLKCFNKTSHMQDIKKAARHAVSFEIIKFKNESFNSPLICPIKNTPLTMENSVVDHEWPVTFDKLITDFIWELIQVSKEDTVIGPRFMDHDIHEKWIYYHKKHAKLRIISVEANAALGNRPL